ncbi:jg4584 [Pararge aegeria aegeria]|uniref:Jg4584 protein n=1 Tax=Pararge aegeria aegeria TaxID=348720 RepID=A0A8S4QX68_9NEOP|nr:jg4584 [Pararge aegeria aegeria]
MDVGVPRCWNGSPELVGAALVDPQRDGQTTLSASQVAAGSKRLRTMEFGTPYTRPMSSSRRLSVDMMMMMKASFQFESVVPEISEFYRVLYSY